jgi:hypothetical protein
MQFKLLVAREMHTGQLVSGLEALSGFSGAPRMAPHFCFVTAGAAAH